jgi:hypothetical protein
MKLEVVCSYEILIPTYQTATPSYNLEDNNMDFHCQKTSNLPKTVHVLWVTNDGLRKRGMTQPRSILKHLFSGCLDRLGTQEYG